MANTILSSKHQIVIPKAIRERMKLKAGMGVTLYPLDDNRAVLVKQPKSYVEALSGLGKEVWESLGGTEKYIKEMREDRDLWSK
ncbi:MAG: AbrB/MazE/SpoVT family DNA-binding domain-containing protein [Patescibacteria group bacterium]|nr:AbrB/MazE/SpoVT family DNA-binding domain-containing protein [Patescibacteria group bacterium]